MAGKGLTFNESLKSLSSERVFFTFLLPACYPSSCFVPGRPLVLWSVKQSRGSASWQFALKEANETECWILLLHETEYLETSDFDSIHGNLDRTAETFNEQLFAVTAIIKGEKEISFTPFFC